MDNKEHIDRLYQEKFKDFEVTPPARVWQNIEASLQKKKRRVLPFWWISGGAIATLLIGLLVFPFFSEKQPNEPTLEKVIITEAEQNPSLHTVEEHVTQEQKSRKKPDINLELVTVKTPIKKIIKKTTKQNTTKKKQQKTSVFNTTEIAIVSENVSNEKTFKNDKISENSNAQKTKPLKEKKHPKINIKTQELVAFNNKNEEKVTEKPQKKWSVTPSIAFLNSGSFSKSSPLGASLDNNPISGENSYSYGVKMGYQINEKWEIQSGIHLQEMQFSTQNVAFRNSALDARLNINYERDETLAYSPSPNPSTNPSTFKGSGFTASNATVNQSFGYIEIPVEVKYMLLKKSKFSTQLVTGVSSLFLSKNKIGASSSDFSGFIGETDNLNTLNFSGNIGFDINYQLFERLQLNINPMFKQQLNTFSKNTNKFKPYSIGIYTGLRYQF